jgi:hypothetical protein
MTCLGCGLSTPPKRNRAGAMCSAWTLCHGLQTMSLISAVFPESGFLCMAADVVTSLGRECLAERAFEVLVLRHVSF